MIPGVDQKDCGLYLMTRMLKRLYACMYYKQNIDKLRLLPVQFIIFCHSPIKPENYQTCQIKKNKFSLTLLEEHCYCSPPTPLHKKKKLQATQFNQCHPTLHCEPMFLRGGGGYPPLSRQDQNRCCKYGINRTAVSAERFQNGGWVVGNSTNSTRRSV